MLGRHDNGCIVLASSCVNHEGVTWQELPANGIYSADLSLDKLSFVLHPWTGRDGAPLAVSQAATSTDVDFLSITADISRSTVLSWPISAALNVVAPAADVITETDISPYTTSLCEVMRNAVARRVVFRRIVKGAQSEMPRIAILFSVSE